MTRQHRREQGVVMFITVLLLAMMGGLGLAALDAATRDRDTAGYYNREASAFYAADAGVQHARAVIANIQSPDETPNFPAAGNPQKIGDTSAYASYIAGNGDLPQYYGDPDVTKAIENTDTSIAEGEGFGGKTKRILTLWRLNIVGQGPSGETARIEAKEAKLFTEGY
jgi:Tfp pilus assembly protein PilX